MVTEELPGAADKEVNLFSTRMLSMLVEASALPMIIVAPTSKILLINTSALELLGIKGSFSKTDLGEYLPVESALTINQIFRSMLDDREQWKECVIEVDVTGLRHTLIIIRISIKGSSEGRIQDAFLLTFRTGTSEKMESHRIKMAALGEVAAGIAHELNTPLANISLIAENLMEDIPEEEIRKQLGKILTQVEFSAEIVKDLLAFSRKRCPTFELVDLNHIINESLEATKVDDGHTVRMDLQEDLPFVKADPFQLQEVLINLIQNAKDAMPDGGELEFKSRAIEGWVEVSIRDHGGGIPDDNMKDIYQPFFTTKPHGQGTGLGLAICNRIIIDHKGELKAKSIAGRGTVFVVRLPRQT